METIFLEATFYRVRVVETSVIKPLFLIIRLKKKKQTNMKRFS